MAVFNSYVKLPEGIHAKIGVCHSFYGCTMDLWLVHWGDELVQLVPLFQVPLVASIGTEPQNEALLFGGLPVNPHEMSQIIQGW